MSRTILYYPTINIEDYSPWLRRAVLYWDHVSSIVPSSYFQERRAKGRKDLPPVLEYLKDEGVYSPVDPFKIIQLQEVAEGMSADFLSYLNDRQTTLKSAAKNDGMLFSIYHEKIDRALRDNLITRGILKRNRAGGLFFTDYKAGEAYMALLAKHVAEHQQTNTTPATDRISFSKILYPEQGGFSNSELVYSISLNELLPTPRPGVKWKDIISFRKNNRHELSYFHEHLRNFKSELIRLKTNKEVHDYVSYERERLERISAKLSKAMNRSNIINVMESLTAFVGTGVPGVLTATGVISATGGLAIGAIAALGSVSVVTRVIKARKALAEQNENEPYNYVFKAQRSLKPRPFSY